MARPTLYVSDRHASAARPVTSLEEALAVLAMAASSRLPDQAEEQDRLALVKGALASARAASAALHVWAAQCLSEYRGSRTTWDVPATSEHLARALADFDSTSREAAGRLLTLMPGAPEPVEPWSKSATSAAGSSLLSG